MYAHIYKETTYPQLPAQERDYSHHTGGTTAHADCGKQAYQDVLRGDSEDRKCEKNSDHDTEHGIVCYCLQWKTL